MIASTVVYRDGVRLNVDVAPDDVAGIRKVVQSCGPGAFFAMTLHEPDEAEMAGVARILGLHRLAVEDSVHPVQRPKLETYGDVEFLVLKPLWYDPASRRIEGGQVAMFMGLDYVVVVRQGEGFELDSARHDHELHTHVLEQGPAALVHALADRVVDEYERVVSALQDEVDEVEAEVFSPQRIRVSRRIYALEGEVNTLRRAVQPLRGPMQRLADGEVKRVSPEAVPFFRDVADHLARVDDAADSLDNLLSSVYDANLSRIGVQQNDDMRRMAAWAGIAAVITVLAGIYGMNFSNMPELRWSFGYPAAILLMVGLSLLLYRRFKKSGWL